MKIRVTKGIIDTGKKRYAVGDEFDIAEAEARKLIEKKVVVAVDAPAESQSVKAKIKARSDGE